MERRTYAYESLKAAGTDHTLQFLAPLRFAARFPLLSLTQMEMLIELSTILSLHTTKAQLVNLRVSFKPKLRY